MSKDKYTDHGQDSQPDKHDAETVDNTPQDGQPAPDEQQGEPTEGEEMSETDKLAKELADTAEALEKEKKEYLFLMAEFDNFRKRTIKEKAEIIKNAAEKVLADILPIVDDFERGIEANQSTEGPEAIKEGMELIYNKLIKYLEQHGVKAIESTGATFDPDYHEAIAMVPAADDSQKGHVIDTPTKGYTINDKVLRHAKVVVAQ